MISIVVNTGQYPTVEAAAADEANVAWYDGQDADDIICTEAFAAVELQRYLRKMAGDDVARQFPITDDDNIPASGELILVGSLDSNKAMARYPGSLGIAISEAVEDAGGRDDSHYTLGSVLNHVLLHQTVIGLETMKQLEKVGDYPDKIIGCIGGGSNFAGVLLPFVKDKIQGKKPDLDVICVEPEACPTVTKGPYAWDYGDVAGMAPIALMYTLGHSFVPPPVHAGGLRYHGMAPIICHLVKLGIIGARAVTQVSTFDAAIQFARTEGIIPAPEPSHAIKVLIDEALKCKEEGKSKNLLLALSGHGHFDLGAYEKYLSGQLEDYEYPEEMVQRALAQLPEVNR